MNNKFVVLELSTTLSDEQFNGLPFPDVIDNDVLTVENYRHIDVKKIKDLALSHALGQMTNEMEVSDDEALKLLKHACDNDLDFPDEITVCESYEDESVESFYDELLDQWQDRIDMIRSLLQIDQPIYCLLNS